jgi:hypothetical protein
VDKQCSCRSIYPKNDNGTATVPPSLNSFDTLAGNFESLTLVVASHLSEEIILTERLDPDSFGTIEESCYEQKSELISNVE